MPLLTGACHCGNLSIRFEATREPGQLGSRACTCGFCVPRRMRWTSDPDGRATITITDPEQLSRYRFGTSTADFLICRRCGYLLAAVSHGDEVHAVINIDVLDEADAFAEASPSDLSGEDVDGRLARRGRTWTPATVEHLSPE